MIKIIDRQMILSYFRAYFVCLTSLLSLYIVVDLFTNLDDFAQGGQSLPTVARNIGSYYLYHIFGIFDRLCEPIVVLAAVFTVAWMQRNNEQVPLLSAGISTRRIVLPVLVSACIMLSLVVINQELIIPRIADKLVLRRDDLAGDKKVQVRGQYEPNGIHINGTYAFRQGRVVRPFHCTIPETVAGRLLHLTAQEARYIPQENVPGESEGPQTQHRGKWELLDTTSTSGEENVQAIPNVLEVRDTGRYYLYVRNIDFEALTRPPNWYYRTSTWKLYQELQKPESMRLSGMAVLFHIRLTRPLLGLILVFLGLSVILRDQNRNVIISSGLCLSLCGLFFVTGYSCRILGEKELLYPALAAWLPVLTFGPPSLVMFDAIHT